MGYEISDYLCWAQHQDSPGGRGEKIHAHELLALTFGVLLLGPGSERER